MTKRLQRHWRDWHPEQRERLREQARARVAGTHAGTPGALAAYITSGREIQAAHLHKIDEAYRAIDEGRADRVLITMPPRHGKTRRASRWGPLWYLRKHPDKRVVLASYSGELAADHGRWVRDTINANPALGLRLSGASSAANRFDLADENGNTTEGGMFTTGVGGILSGRGADLLIVDDPIKDRRDADSETMRSRLWEWWTNVALTRLEPGGAVIVIQTRWHEDDLAGRLLANEPDDWLHIDLPAIALDEHDILGRKPGQALWPARYGRKALEVLKRRVGERVWAALYQQRPRPLEGGIFKWPWIIETRLNNPLELPDLSRIVIGIDPSGGGEADEDGDEAAVKKATSTDETGIVASGIDRNGHVWVLADESGLGSSDAWSRRACLLAIRLKADAFAVENNFGGDMAGTILRAAWRQLMREGVVPKGLLMPRVKEVHAIHSKRLRAEPVAQLYENRLVHHVGEYPVLEQQLTTWVPGMDSPDRMDAHVHGVTELTEGVAPISKRGKGDDQRLTGRR